MWELALLREERELSGKEHSNLAESCSHLLYAWV